MSVKLSVPTHLLSRPEVAEAVQTLILVLGGRDAPSKQAVDTPARSKAVLPPIQPPDAPPEPRRAAPTAVPQGVPAVAEDEPALSESEPEGMSLETFFDGLPLNSQRFLAILQEKGVVKVDEMVERLGLKNAKAVGGITGAIGRWGPVRGVKLPYERFILDGVRAWRWTGPAMARGIPPSDKPARKAAPPAAKKAPRRARKPAAQKTDALPTTIDGMLANLGPKALRLAEVLRKRGTLARSEAAAAAGAEHVSEVTGLIREINATAKHLGQKLALDDLDVKGGISYRWLGLQAPEPKPEEAPGDTDLSTATIVSKGGLIRRRRKP